MMFSKKHVLIAVVVLAVFALGHDWAVTLIGGFALAAGYLIDVRLRPRYTCATCGGSGRLHGWLFDWGQSRCPDCGGTQAHVRWGARHFGSPAMKAEHVARRQAKRAGYERLTCRA